MGLMDAVEVEPGRFVVTPHPVTLEGQTNIAAELRPGDTLYSFLSRSIDLADQWEVTIGGVVVPVEMWMRVKPKHGQTIEVRGAVNKQVLMIVAMVALTYFTMGAGATWAAGWGLSAAATSAVYAGAYIAGAMIINKVLAPKPPKDRKQDAESVFSLSGARNRVRQNEPFGLLFGSVKIAPDVLSMPYTWYQGNDQHLAFVLTPGINVARIEAYQNGDTPLASFDGVQTWTAGMSGMAQQTIPLYSNADTINGAELANTATWVERRTSLDTVRIQVNLEYILGGLGTSGKPYPIGETIEVQYRAVGSGIWLPLITRTFRSDSFSIKRDTIAADVVRGEYDVRVRMLGQGNYSGKNTQKNDFTWSTLTSVQADDTDYAGVSRFAVQMKATGQLQGAPDEIRVEAHAEPMPIWNGTAWVTATDRSSGLSNPGAQILMYARGINDENGKLIAGIGLDDQDIDIPALQAFMLHCAANGYEYDFQLTSVRSHDETLAAIALAGFGQVTWAGGKLSVAWAADEQPLSGVVNMATIKKGQFQVDYTLANAADGIEYTYFDRTDWQAKTLRVAAPGVTTMLNPATLQGEGITSEAHAAELARYHLAQSLYQYKDISYSTDLEHLSYRRLSLLALQHDLTQWGYGGRVQAAVSAAGVVTLTLDEPVPAPAAGNAYIGLRIPGESVYRIFTVAPFTGESSTITLAGTWPADAALPGERFLRPNGEWEENPAHDTIWIYDFKQTPGYRVRVVDIQPEPGLKGAAIAVVPEGPEFWDYVKNGVYVPAPNQSLLQTRPVASNLRVTEAQIVQGDTKFTELTATFDVSGPVAYSVVLSAPTDMPLVEMADTTTRTARWRIDGPGVYAVSVRPYAPDGTPGVAATIVYTTIGAGSPPTLFDYFEVQQLAGGVRKYLFGFNESDDAPVDLAGAEIRYRAGATAGDWATMTPLGADGFFTSAVEMVLPPSGQWTFACRSRNTAGILSATAKTVTVTLADNLGEVVADLDAGIMGSDQAAADAMAAALAADAKAAQEIIDRLAADAVQTAETAVLRAQVGDILQADVHDSAKAYPSGDLVQSGSPAKLYRALQPVPVGIALTNAAYWEVIGNYASLGEAVSATAVLSTATASELDAVAQTVTLHEARMPAGTGGLAADARVTSVESAAASATGAVAERVAITEARMSGTSGALATQAQVTAAESAAADATGAVAGRLSAIEARTSGTTGALATQAQVNAAESASVDRDNANAVAVLQVKAGLTGGGNLLRDALTTGFTDWSVLKADGGWGEAVNLAGTGWTPDGLTSIGANHPGTPTGPVIFDQYVPGVEVGKAYIFSVRAQAHRSKASGEIYWLNDAGGVIAINGTNAVDPGPSGQTTGATSISSWPVLLAMATAPAGAVRAMVRLLGWNNGGSAPYVWFIRPQFEQAAEGQTLPSPWSAGGVEFSQSAAITQSLTASAGPGGAEAQATLTARADGKVTGYKLTVGGGESAFDLLSDRFSVTSDDGSFVQQGGRTIRKAGGYMTVDSVVGFGVGSEFVHWRGPIMPLASCSRGNAIRYEVISGAAYFKQIFVGARTFSAYTPFASASAEVQVQVPDTAGGNISVEVGYARSVAYTGSQVGRRLSAGAGSSAAQVKLYRKIGTAAEALVATYNYTGGIDLFDEFDSINTATSFVTGSSTYTDTSGGLLAKRFRVEVVSSTLQAVNSTGPGTTIVSPEAGNVAVTTTE